MRRGYIKTLEAVHVAPSELAFTFRDSQETATLQEVLKLRDEVWFSRGVALAEQCNRSIVDASIRACEELRQSSQQRQQIFAAACSVEHAEMVAALYRKVGYHAEAIHSLQAKAQQRNTLQRLRNGRLDVIVQVQMLGEGFDHPPLSVAAVFRPFRTLSPYVQFIGRVMRVMTQNSPLSPENRGIVVTHVGLNTDRHWDQFRQLDDDDQALLSGMLNGMTSTEIAAAEKANGAKSDRSAAELALMPRHFAPEMLVEWERITDVETSNFAEIDLVNNEGPVLPEEVPTNKPAYKVGLIAGPQQRRREARSRLKTSVDDAIRQVLVQARLPGMGRHIGRMFPMFRHQDNWSALRFRLYIELNRTVGRRPGSGNEWSLTEVEQALESLPKISDRIVKELVQRQQQSQQKCRRFAGY
jgi:hypothetical protein